MGPALVGASVNEAGACAVGVFRLLQTNSKTGLFVGRIMPSCQRTSLRVEESLNLLRPAWCVQLPHHCSRMCSTTKSSGQTVAKIGWGLWQRSQNQSYDIK